jgi:hypothetical protein
MSPACKKQAVLQEGSDMDVSLWACDFTKLLLWQHLTDTDFIKIKIMTIISCRPNPEGIYFIPMVTAIKVVGTFKVAEWNPNTFPLSIRWVLYTPVILKICRILSFGERITMYFGREV